MVGHADDLTLVEKAANGLDAVELVVAPSPT